jgi:hypothetical protein
MNNIIKIIVYIDDGDMGYFADEAIINLKNFVSITALCKPYRGKKLLQIGTEKMFIDEETAERIWSKINEQ